MTTARVIETDDFPFEFLSKIGERESWRKEVFRPVYYLHKWWAKRLGSVFRGIILGSLLHEGADFVSEFYRVQNFSNVVLFDPFMGSGVTIGEAHKLQLTTLGRDINPVAVEMVRVSLGPMEQTKIESEFQELSGTVGKKILALYQSKNTKGKDVDTLYYFWVMQAKCPTCTQSVDLFPSWIFARNAYPNRKRTIQILCPSCHNVFSGVHGQSKVICSTCKHSFSPSIGNTSGSKATCSHCNAIFPILESFKRTGQRPDFRLYAKLTITLEDRKEYLAASQEDVKRYLECSSLLRKEVEKGSVRLPKLELEHGYNTTQAMNYGFMRWQDFFNDRQLLALGWLQAAIEEIDDRSTRDALALIFSGILEFNNIFASYKGEGTGAVRHMFSHHILKPERIPIEANVWGTSKSSGSFSTLFRRRLLTSIAYRNRPTEFDSITGKRIMCSLPFSGRVESGWPTDGNYLTRAIYLSMGDSGATRLPNNSIDLVITDPPFFDNVHYSELADFFYAWQRLYNKDSALREVSTRNLVEVQDANAGAFARKLGLVFTECERVMKKDGLLVFTYHHSREEGWTALAQALLQSGITPVNTHPVKSEMSVATPKSQTREPIQLDNIIVCRKAKAVINKTTSKDHAFESARLKLDRLKRIGFQLSHSDAKVVYYGQLLATIKSENDITVLSSFVNELERLAYS